MATERSNVLIFPPVKKGRVRRSKSMDATGNLRLLLLYRDDEPIPENVKRLDQPNWPIQTFPERNSALLLALMVYSQLGERKKEAIERMARHAAFDGDRWAAEVLNMLRLGPTVNRAGE